MSYKEWFCDVRLRYGTTWYTISPHYVEVKLPVTDEVFTAEVKWFDDGTSGNIIVPSKDYCGCTLEVYAGTLKTDLKLLFRGLVTKIGQEYTGILKEKAEKYIVAHGFGKILQDNERKEKLAAGPDYSMFNSLAIDAISKGLLAGKEIYPSPVRTVGGIDGNQPYWDMFNRIAREADWIFYVDNNGILKAFPRGAYVNPQPLVPDFRAQIEFDATDIVNTIEVYGKADKTIGSDLEFTESTVNWGGLNVCATSEWKQAGSVSILSYDHTYGFPLLERTFSPALDLSSGGQIHFYYRILSEPCPAISISHSELEVKMYTDDNNYFATTTKQSGGKVFRIAGGVEFLQEAELNLAFNWLGPTSWTEVGNPQWNQISKISFKLKFPNNAFNALYIDDLYFDKIARKGVASSPASIAKFGVRKGKSVYNDNITSDEQAATLADLIVQLKKDPILTVRNVEVDDAFAYNPGEKATISIFGTNLPAIIKEIDYRFDGKMLRTNLELTEVRALKLEDILQSVFKSVYGLELAMSIMKKFLVDQILLDTKAELIDWSRVTSGFPIESWVSMDYYPILFESSEGYIVTSANQCEINFSYGRLRFIGLDEYIGSAFVCPKLEFLRTDKTIYFQTIFGQNGTVGFDEAAFGILIPPQPPIQFFCGFVTGPYFYSGGYPSGTIYARYWNLGTGESKISAICPIELGGFYRLTFKYFPEGNVYFYLGDELKAHFTFNSSNLPCLAYFGFKSRACHNTIDFLGVKVGISH